MPAGNPLILVSDLLTIQGEKGSQRKKSSKSMYIVRHSPPPKICSRSPFSLRKKTVSEGCVESYKNNRVLPEDFPLIDKMLTVSTMKTESH